MDQKARELADGVKSAADLKAAAEKAGLEGDIQADYKLGGALGKAGASPALDEAVYALKEGELIKTPVKVGDDWVVVGVTKRKEADLAEFAKQRDQLTQSALRTRQDQVYEDYLAAAVDRLKHDGKVKIYQEVLDTMEEDEPPPPPPFPPPFSLREVF